MAADFAADTAVTALGEGRYEANLGGAWTWFYPSGGALMAIAMRAMQKELEDTPELRPVSAHTVFYSPIPEGRIEVVVSTRRVGASATHLNARLGHKEFPGEGLEVAAVFVRDRTGPELLGVEPPDVPSWRDLPEAKDRPNRPFLDNYDIRIAFGATWWEKDFEPGPARCDRWFRYRVPQMRQDGTLDPLSLLPIVDLMPTPLVLALGPKRENFYAPSVDLTLHFLEPTKSEWVLTSTRCPYSGRGFASGDVEVWDDHGTLIATATQMMFLRTRRPKGP